jgi:hypothetical protein
LYAKGVSKKGDWRFIKYELGLYFRAGFAGGIGFSYNGCKDQFSGGGCITGFVEAGLLGQFEVIASHWISAGAGARAA